MDQTSIYGLMEPTQKETEPLQKARESTSFLTVLNSEETVATITPVETLTFIWPLPNHHSRHLTRGNPCGIAKHNLQ